MKNIAKEVEIRKKDLAEAQRLRKLALDQRSILNAALDYYLDEIEDAKDWLFLNEPRTIKVKFCYEPPLDDDGYHDPEPAQRWFEREGDCLEQEDLLPNALGYEDEDEMWKGLGLNLDSEANRKNGALYEVTFKGDGTATIKEAKE